MRTGADFPCGIKRSGIYVSRLNTHKRLIVKGRHCVELVGPGKKRESLSEARQA